MIKVLYLAVLSAIIISLTSCSVEQNSTSPIQKEVSAAKQYIVVLNDNFGNTVQSVGDINSIVNSIFADHGILPDRKIAVWDKVVKGFCAQLSQNDFLALQNDSRIKYIEEDQEVSILGFVTKDNEKGNSILAQTPSWGVAACGGSVASTSSTGVAWIVDTGVDLDHPDLNVDVTRSRTFITSGSDAASADDLNGHGSHVAGIIAAKNNTVGALGVCSGASVIAVKVLNLYGSGYTSTIISGLNYVYSNLIANKLNVVNLSLGGAVSTTLDNAVSNLAGAGAYVVIAAGNNAASATNYSPSRVNGTRIYTISAYDNTGRFATFSNYGNPPVDYSAPGVSIYSCYKNGGYATMSGTSMSAPFVSGILLATNGTINTNGTVTGDKDSTPDYKAVR